MLKDSFIFYYKATGLKDMLRQGAVQWKVDKERLESIAEHTFGCMILAIGLKSELNINVDLDKVLEMLTIHELEELSIGDVTPLSNIDKQTLKLQARMSVSKMVKSLNLGNELLSLTDEYNEGKTPEAKFAKAVDKLECVLEFKKYQDKGQVSIKNIENPPVGNNQRLIELFANKNYDLADIFFLYHCPAFKDYGITEEYWFNHLKNLPVESTAKPDTKKLMKR